MRRHIPADVEQTLVFNVRAVGRTSWTRTILQRLFHDTAAQRLLFQQLLSQCFKGRVVLLQQRLSTLTLFGN